MTVDAKDGAGIAARPWVSRVALAASWRALRALESACICLAIQAIGLVEQLGHRQQVVEAEAVGFLPGFVALSCSCGWG